MRKTSRWKVGALAVAFVASLAACERPEERIREVLAQEGLTEIVLTDMGGGQFSLAARRDNLECHGTARLEDGVVTRRHDCLDVVVAPDGSLVRRTEATAEQLGTEGGGAGAEGEAEARREREEQEARQKASATVAAEIRALAALAPQIPDPSKAPAAQPCPADAFHALSPQERRPLRIDYELLVALSGAGPGADAESRRQRQESFGWMSAPVFYRLADHLSGSEGDPLELLDELGRPRPGQVVSDGSGFVLGGTPFVAVLRAQSHVLPSIDTGVANAYEPGQFSGVVALVDRRRDAVICHAPLTARSSETVSFQSGGGVFSADAVYFDYRQRFDAALAETLQSIGPPLMPAEPSEAAPAAPPAP